MALKSTNQPIRWKERIGTTVLGVTVTFAGAYGYEYVIYPWLLAKFGLVGFAIAVIGSIVLCLGALAFYDATKKDWLGVEAIRLLQDQLAAGKIRRFFLNVFSRGDLVALVVLSCATNPLITVVHMRRGSGDRVMTARDWKVFWASIVIGNGWWGLLGFAAIEVFNKWLAPLMSPLQHWLGLA